MNMQSLVGRSTLALVLFVTAALKFGASGGGSEYAHAWQLLAEPGVRVAVAIVELVIGGLLLTSRWRLGAWGVLGFVVMSLLYLLFLVVNGVTLSNCGCFGVREIPIQWHLGLLCGMSLLAASCLAQERTASS